MLGTHYSVNTCEIGWLAGKPINSKVSSYLHLWNVSMEWQLHWQLPLDLPWTPDAVVSKELSYLTSGQQGQNCFCVPVSVLWMEIINTHAELIWSAGAWNRISSAGFLANLNNYIIYCVSGSIRGLDQSEISEAWYLQSLKKRVCHMLPWEDRSLCLPPSPALLTNGPLTVTSPRMSLSS